MEELFVFDMPPCCTPGRSTVARPKQLRETWSGCLDERALRRRSTRFQTARSLLARVPAARNVVRLDCASGKAALLPALEGGVRSLFQSVFRPETRATGGLVAPRIRGGAVFKKADLASGARALRL